MSTPLLIAIHLLNLAVVPLLLVGVVRKVKARMQNRLGAPVLQPFYDVAKLLRARTIRDGERIVRVLLSVADAGDPADPVVAEQEKPVFVVDVRKE